MKKISAILLLLLFFFSTMGYYVIYSVQLQQVKEEAKKQILAGVPDSLLEVVEHTEAIQWEEDGDEFYYNGNMYDVVRTEIKNGQTFYHCVNDKKEKELLNKFAHASRSAHHPAQGKGGKLMVKFQVTEYTCVTIPPLNWENRPGNKKYFSHTAIPISSFREIVAPPPKA